MDKKMLGVIGGASALALLGGASAMASTPMSAPELQPARSYTELLDPIPDALNTLIAEDTRAASAPNAGDAPIQVAQMHHHHHHHHHHHWRRHHHHHHHHHHHRWWRHL
jgi:hypothetical protein